MNRRFDEHADAKRLAKMVYDQVSRLPHFDRARVAAEYLAISEDERLALGIATALLTAYVNDLIHRGLNAPWSLESRLVH